MIYSKVLVVQGPNLTLYKEKESEIPLVHTINAELLKLKDDLEIVQTNDLTSLIDLLVSKPDFYDAIIINLDYYTDCFILKQTFQLLDIPIIEINCRAYKQPSCLKDISLLEIAGELSADIYKTALTYLTMNTEES
jgi:3-dehydroquinate dehydratase